jgi:hypothetical protein
MGGKEGGVRYEKRIGVERRVGRREERGREGGEGERRTEEGKEGGVRYEKRMKGCPPLTSC